jgi:hypothetical protein
MTLDTRDTKKSTKGIEAPKPDMDLIRKRLGNARRLAEGV